MAGLSGSAQGAQASAPVSNNFRASGLAPAGAPRQLSDSLYLFEDTCNVFIVRDGPDCVLIDFGSGKVLDRT